MPIKLHLEDCLDDTPQVKYLIIIYEIIKLK